MSGERDGASHADRVPSKSLPSPFHVHRRKAATKGRRGPGGPQDAVADARSARGRAVAAARRPTSAPPRKSAANAPLSRPESPDRSRKVGRMTTIVLQSGTKWGTFPLAKPVRGGGAPPTPPPRIDSTSLAPRTTCALAFHGTFDHTLDAKNRLTIPSKFRARARGQGVPRQGRGPLHLALSRGDVHGDDRARRSSGLNPLSPQARELQRASSTANAMDDGAGLGRPRDAAARASWSTPAIGREVVDHRRRRLPRALGPLGLGGLRHRPHAARA